MPAPSYADSPRNATNYLGQSYRFTPTYIRQRNPTGTDIRPKENQGYYPIGSIWMNISTPPEIWILARIFSNAGITNAEWVLIANSLISGPLLTLSDNAGVVVPPSSDVANPPGNIQFVAGAGLTIVGTPSSNLITITNTGTGTQVVNWIDESTNFNALSNNGYFCTATLTATLPANPSQGDVVAIFSDTTSFITVTANTGHKIRIGNVISATSGSIGSTRQGDSVYMIYRAVASTWETINAVGSWNVT